MTTRQTKTRKSKSRRRSTIPGARRSEIVLTTLPVDRLVPNDFNPNEFSPEMARAHLAEVRRRRRPSKQPLVRPVGDDHEIIDGEQEWIAAKAAGLTEVQCEVIEADNFQAMRENFVRNQRGTRNRVKVGRLFERMKELGGLSTRKLAKNLNIPASTVEHFLDYPAAVELRHSGAPETAEEDIAKLNFRQVAEYRRLPAEERDAWLDGVAVLARAKTETEQAGDADGGEESGNERANATTDDEENATSSQEGEQRGQEQHEADAAEASAARKGRAQAGTRDYATDNFDDVLQGVKTAARVLARYEEPLARLRETLSLEEKTQAIKPLEDISRLAGQMLSLFQE
jgi:ParB-like chromosome segregation protein Spo0J